MLVSRLKSLALVSVLLAHIALSASAQTYPSKPIKIVVPATPGGAIDFIARLAGDKLSQSLGQPVDVE
jgi:tripartite-type tricarboxylate transporter receptor subunit TctC